MQVEFRQLPMMALRSRPGEILDEVSREGLSFLIERNGQPKACLVPISYFLPDVQTSRLTADLDSIMDSNERCRIAINDEREIQLIFSEPIAETTVDVTVTLPHGYPNNAPVVFASPIDDGCPHRWPDGTLCIYGAVTMWNPGKHDVMHTVASFRRWIQHYSVWKQTRQWPT